MSAKNRDNHYRWRNRTVAFRVSPEEDKLIERFVKLSRLTKQDYITLDNYHRLNAENGRLYRENERLSRVNDRLQNENENLRAENRDYKLLRKVFGSRQIDDLLARAREAQQSKQREKRFRNHDFER